MGYIEDRKAEGARQAFEAAKQAEAARVLNQGNPAELGLSKIVADQYLNGISPEDEYKLMLAQKAKEANAKAAYDKLAADRFNASKGYVSAKHAIDSAPIQYRREENPDEGGYTFHEYRELNPADVAAVKKFQQNVDQGLASEYAKMREAYDRYK